MSIISSLWQKIFPVTEEKQILQAGEQTIAERGTEKQRKALAGNERTSQDVLLYMAEKDPSASVRKDIAKNPSTPLQAATILSSDKAEDVRMALARRLVKILPALSEDKYSQLYAYAVQSLGDLALDEVLKVRRALAETLKSHAHTPPSVALQLAKDLEREVSEPILRFCTALSDNALVEILQTHPAHWAAEAVARRKELSDLVSEAVIKTGNRKAGQYLIENTGANIVPSLLETIIVRAREYPEWHKPLASRAALTPLMAQKLAVYVDKSVRKILIERSDLDDDTIEKISNVMKRRIERHDDGLQTAEDPVDRARQMYAAKSITEQVLSDAIAMRDVKFVMAALAFLAGTSLGNIEKVFDVKAPKSICAIAWKAGLSMRFALQLQQTLGAVPVKQLIYPRDGINYPLTEEELKWQLDMIGIPI